MALRGGGGGGSGATAAQLASVTTDSINTPAVLSTVNLLRSAVVIRVNPDRTSGFTSTVIYNDINMKRCTVKNPYTNTQTLELGVMLNTNDDANASDVTWSDTILPGQQFELHFDNRKWCVRQANNAAVAQQYAFIEIEYFI